MKYSNTHLNVNPMGERVRAYAPTGKKTAFSEDAALPAASTGYMLLMLMLLGRSPPQVGRIVHVAHWRRRCDVLFMPLL